LGIQAWRTACYGLPFKGLQPQLHFMATSAKLFDWQLFGVGPDLVFYDCPFLDFSGKLNLRRQQLHRVVLNIEDREEHHDFPALI